MWDDGWDDPRTLWEFDKERFPNDFTLVAQVAKAVQSGTGVWLSPWGGYGFAKQMRLQLGATHGYEINEGGFSLAGSFYTIHCK